MFQLSNCNLTLSYDNYSQILKGKCYTDCLTQVIDKNIRVNLNDTFYPIFTREYNKDLDKR